MTRTIFAAWHADSLIDLGRIDQAREIARSVLAGRGDRDADRLPRLDQAYAWLVLSLADRAGWKLPEARANMNLALDQARLARQQPHLANVILNAADLGVVEALRAMRDGNDWESHLKNDVAPLLAEARSIVRPETSRNCLGLY
ncbi:unnamed protein product, partial [Phaeothamnion confervicola]